MTAASRESGPRWQIRGGRELVPAPFLVAGIVNITPDSFSDGGDFARTGAAVRRVRQLIAEGADMVDLGAESTRPGAEDIGSAEEWRRLAPVLRKTLLARAVPGGVPPAVTVAVDTFRAATAAAALEMPVDAGAETAAPGLDVINDVSGGAFDPGMADVLAQFKPGYVLGHSPARPQVMQKNPRYGDVVEDLLHWFSSRMKALARAGLPEKCICLDPCIGFGKNLDHTVAIIKAIPRFMALGRPLYFGISRKSFLGEITGLAVSSRDTATQAAVALLAEAGVAVHRVHQVADTVATLKIVRALSSRGFAL
jgi:dihydropteroate synthase